ncbi:MAG: transglutaminase-like cysteine peptidase [Desulfovibrionaceae bacterium]|nr:transglutaminase-like cysteine peptidase [Desulfovibrionaceae bacterium]
MQQQSLAHRTLQLGLAFIFGCVLTLWVFCAWSMDVTPPKILLFNTVEFKRPLESLPAWLQLLERNQRDPIFVPGRKLNSTTTWDSFKAKAKDKSGLALLRYVHNFWNKWPYCEDMKNWGKPDYWAIPAEFLRKSGDCEDYAIIKYFTLRELGIPAEDMRIVVLRDTVRNLAHAVLVVYLQGDAYVLDNLSSSVLSHTHFRHYLPQYSVNEVGRWAHLKGRPVKTASKASSK